MAQTPNGVVRGSRERSDLIELVVTDLDGTLWDTDLVVPRDTLAALSELERKGVPVLAATSRRTWTAGHYFGRNGLALPAVLLNGAITRLADGGELIASSALSADESATVLACMRRNDLSPTLYLEQHDRDLVSTASSSASPLYIEWARAHTTIVDDLEPVCGTDPVYSFCIVGHSSRPSLDAVAAELQADDSVDVNALVMVDNVYGGFTIHIASRAVSKWTGVLAFCEHSGIDPTNVLAVGDGENDVELLAQASVSCAMAASVPELLAVADHVLPAGDSGWSKLLDYL